MKKALLLSAALLATSSMFAVDMYVVGGNVNGQEAWSSTANKMTETSANVFEWEGQTLGSGFKMNNGGWDNDEYNIGAGATTQVTLGTPLAYVPAGGDFTFANGGIVSNPKVVLDMNAKTVTVTGTLGEAPEPEPVEFAYYIIGSNVNGQSWALAQSDAKFTDEGNGIWKWEGKILGSGFKINDGTWSNSDYNIGSAGSDLNLGEAFYYWANGSSGNIAFNGFTEVENPVVVLNTNDETITVTGAASGVASYYLAGVNGDYEFDTMPLFEELSEGVYEAEVYVVETSGKCKVTDDGWAHQYGTNLPDEVFIDPENLSVYLEPVNGEGGDVPYELNEGTWYVTFDLNELTLTFSSESHVENIVLGSEADAVYYNLHGQKVNNPERGIYVKVVGGKALKVVK